MKDDEQEALDDYCADSDWANDGGNLLAGDPEPSMPEPKITPTDYPHAA